MIRRYHIARDVEGVTALQQGVSDGSATAGSRSRTLGSGFTLEVCANTTLCTNLTQHIRTVRGAVSQISLILVLIAVIFPHVG